MFRPLSGILPLVKSIDGSRNFSDNKVRYKLPGNGLKSEIERMKGLENIYVVP